MRTDFCVPCLRPMYQPTPAPTADLDVWVLTHEQKQATTPKMLKSLGLSFRIYTNPDWDWPEGHPEPRTDRTARPEIRQYSLYQYRAFRGHQEILRRADPDKLTLVFEDDARLTASKTIPAIRRQLAFAAWAVQRNLWDAVSLHGRRQSPMVNTLSCYGQQYGTLKPIPYSQLAWGHSYFLEPAIAHYRKLLPDGLRWHEGCLAYVIGEAGREKWRQAGHGFGLPCDLFLVNGLTTLVARTSLFAHDDSQASLIDRRKR